MLALVIKRKKIKFIKNILKFIANRYNNLLSANGSYEDEPVPLGPLPQIRGQEVSNYCN